MNMRTALAVAGGVLALASAAAVAGFYGYRTVATTGEAALQAMDAGERTALQTLSKLDRAMSAEQVQALLGEPSEDRYVLATWNGFGGSALSQARVYYAERHPRKIRWIKLGYFVYEKDL